MRIDAEDLNKIDKIIDDKNVDVYIEFSILNIVLVASIRDRVHVEYITPELIKNEIKEEFIFNFANRARISLK